MVLTRISVTYSHVGNLRHAWRLVALLDSLKRLHAVKVLPTKPDELLCTNYARKVKQQCQRHEAFLGPSALMYLN